MRNVLLLCALMLHPAFHPALALDVPMTHSVTMEVISEYLVDLTSGTTVTFRTTNLSPGSDPVLHLLNGEGKEVAVNDNSGPGSGARLVYASPSGGAYRLVVRARWPNVDGTCDLTMNGAAWQSGVAFGGWQRGLSQLRAGEALETVKLPNGAKGAHLLFVLKADGLGIELRGYGNGTSGGAFVSIPSPLGDRVVIVGVNRAGTAGLGRLVRNDAAIAGHDVDHDGLGDELESKIGTCSTLTGIAGNFECDRATDPRDTDGDGISDGWEVLGRRDVSPHQPLPLWGADPRHKDLFVEVDFMQRSLNEPEERMTPATARKFAAYYGDQVGTVDELRLAYHAAILRNPDLQPGIRVHLDIGVDATVPADVTIFGDWGGHDVIPPVQDSRGNWIGARYQDAWRDHLLPARRGIFRHASCPTGGDGGSNSQNHISFSSGINAPWGLAHESGHAQGLGHSGPAYITGVVDVNCKPNYASMMNYAYQREDGIGFGDGRSASPLTNTALKEWRAVVPSDAAYLHVLKEVYRYYVDFESGHVDWNRDGEFAPAGTTVRAYANYSPNAGGCEYTRYNEMMATNSFTAVSPAIARYRGRTYVFWSTASSIFYRWTSSAMDCSAPSTTPCAEWNGVGGIPIAGAQGLDAVQVRAGSAARLLVVAVTASGRLFQTRLAISNGVESWTSPSPIDADETVSGEPSLAAMSGCNVTLAYKAGDRTLKTRTMSCASWSWNAAQSARDSDGTLLRLAARGSPSIARGYLPAQGASQLLLGAFINGNGTLLLYSRDSMTGRWRVSSDLESGGVAASGRPAMAWVPFGDGTYPGRLYVMYRQPSNSAYRWMWSYVNVTTDGVGNKLSTGMIGLDGWFDNVWYVGSGHDLLYEPGIDTNLRAVTATVNGVFLRPKADGIQNFSYRNYDDWQVHRVGLCQQVVNPGGTVMNPIRCPESDW